MRTLLVPRTPPRRPGRLSREILAVARFLAEVEAIRIWGAPLPADDARPLAARVA